MIANLTLAGIGMLTGIIAARLLGPDGRGELTAIQTWPTFIASLAMLGFPEAITYYSAKRPENAARYLTTAVFSTLAVSGFFILIGYIFLPYLLDAQSLEIVRASQLYLLLIPIFSIVGMLYHPLRGRNDLIVWNILRLSPSIGWLFVLILAVVLDIYSAIWLAKAYLIVLTLSFFPIFTVVRWRIPGPYKPDTKVIKPLMMYGLPSVASTLPSYLNLRLDQMIMVAFINPTLLGIYAASVAWGSAIVPVISALGIVAFPKIASISDNVEKINSLIQSIHQGLIIGSFLSFLLILLTPIFIPILFGQEFTPAIPSAILLVIAGFISSVNLILEEGTRGLGKPKSVLYAEVVGLFFTCIALFLLLRPLDIIGAAVSSIVGYSMITLVLLYQLVKETGCTIKELLIPTSLDFYQIMAKTKGVIRSKNG
jgi:O-antigen/teichoic acid export membrane protein